MRKQTLPCPLTCQCNSKITTTSHSRCLIAHSQSPNHPLNQGKNKKRLWRTQVHAKKNTYFFWGGERGQEPPPTLKASLTLRVTSPSETQDQNDKSPENILT